MQWKDCLLLNGLLWYRGLQQLQALADKIPQVATRPELAPR